MSKRACTDGDGSHPSSPRPLPSSNPPLPQIKRERSPSPLFVKKRLISSGTRRFTPVPVDCLPASAGYRQNRLKWVEKCVKELEGLNLIPERKLIRDDGLIIDWWASDRSRSPFLTFRRRRSHVPVLSDTLQPDPQDLAATIMLAHRSNAQSRHSRLVEEPTANGAPSSSGITETSPKKKVLPPPRLPPKERRNNAFHAGNSRSIESNPPERPRIPDEFNLSNRSSASDTVQNGQVSTPPDLVGVQTPSSSMICTEEDMSEMTLKYLGRYVQTYEADRASLASAYARNASFAYRVHEIVRDVSGDPSFTRASSFSGTKQARLDIVTTLLTLPRLHSDGRRSNAAHLDYDIFYLGLDLGMFVVCRVVIFSKTVVHNFILQRKEADLEDAASDGVWPLAATAHQILVFET